MRLAPVHGARAEARRAAGLAARARRSSRRCYYPRTLPGQPLYRDLGYDESKYPVARRLACEVLSLPVHPGLSQSDLETIVVGRERLG